MLFQNLLKSFRDFGDNVFVDSYWSGTSVRDPGEGGELHLMKLKMVIFNHQREDTSFLGTTDNPDGGLYTPSSFRRQLP
jgi:hypothetical protein